MVATRELATNSGKVMKEVDKSGFVVITKDGKPLMKKLGITVLSPAEALDFL